MNRIVKIISKALSLKLDKKLGCMIPFTHTTFIRERNIIESFIIVNEIINQCYQLRHKGVIYKVDFEKVFDSMAWPFLLWLLSTRDFKVV